MRMRSSVKVAAVVLGTCAAIYGGWTLYAKSRLKDFEIREIAPGRVNLVAISPGAGYRIIVANQVAQLAEVDEREGSAAEAREDRLPINPRRLPIREWLQTLQGDEKALGALVMSLNDMKDADLPTTQITWTKDDIEKALAGDPVLIKKLEDNLHTTLNGRPQDSLHLSALLNGIVLEIPVPVTVSVAGKEKTLTGIALEPFKTNFVKGVEQSILQRFNPTTAVQLGVYREQATMILDGKVQAEDVAGSLRARFAESRVKGMAVKPERVLRETKVLINESFIVSASKQTYPGPNRQTLTDISIRLTEEGRMRLWKYSNENKGFQLLLIVDSVAVAAPVISTELAQSEITITQVPNERLAMDAVNTMNEVARGGGS